MSFGDMPLPSTLPPAPQPGTPGRLTKSAASELRSNLSALAGNTSALRACGVSDVTRSRLLRSQNREIARNAVSLASDLDANDSSTEELRSDLRTHLSDFHTALREYAALESEAPNPPTLPTATVAVLPELGSSRTTQADATESTPLVTTSATDIALQRELSSTIALRTARSDVLRDIQSDVSDVHGIMRDLAEMVGDQSETLDTLIVDVEHTQDYTTSAHRELSRTRRGRQGKRRLFFTILLITCIIIVSLLLVILT